jgi:hypothetical protein
MELVRRLPYHFLNHRLSSSALLLKAFLRECDWRQTSVPVNEGQIHQLAGDPKLRDEKMV